MDDPLDDGRGSTGGDDARFRSLLQDLKALEAREPAGPSPDPAQVAAHFAGVGDESLLERASRDPSLRGRLADLARELPDLEAAAAESLSPDVRRRALEEFDATVEEASPVRRVRSGAWSRAPFAARAAAAVLLVALPLGVVASLASRDAEASPRLALEGLDRVDSEGGVVAEGPVQWPLGMRVTPTAGERVALRLHGARVVFRGGDAAHVACDGPLGVGSSDPESRTSACDRAVLALDRGEALVEGPRDGESAPASLRLPDGGRLEIERGRAHVAWTEPGRAALALDTEGRARWTPAGTPLPVSIAGPASFLLEDGVAKPDREGEAGRGGAASLFRDLEFFGGSLGGGSRKRVPGQSISSRLWRVLRPESGALGDPQRSAERASDAAGTPALRFDLDAGTLGRVAWRPDASALQAGVAVVVVRVREDAAGVAGGSPGRIAGARLVVGFEGLDGASTVVDLEASQAGEAPAGVTPVPGGIPVPDAVPRDPAGLPPVRSIIVPLPSGWGDRLLGGELVLSIAAESPSVGGGGSGGVGTRGMTVWFESVVLGPKGSEARLAEGVQGE